MSMSVRRKALAALATGVSCALTVRALRRPRRYELAGRTILITGGSRGLGLALAREAAAQCARVAICGRDPASLERARAALLRSGAAIAAFTCDVSDRAEVEQLIAAVQQRFGAIDMLINNAGVIEVGPASVMSIDEFDEAMRTNFWGVLFPTLAVLPDMRARRIGRIVNITSIGGRISVPHLLPYCTSKFAAVGLSQGFGVELAAEGIRVTTVCPGLMMTGSPRNAIFMGKHRAEYAWFSIADSLPGLSVNARTAARRILEAAKRGDPELRFPLTTEAVVAVSVLAPRLTASILRVINRLLPGPGRRPSARYRGAEAESWISPSWLTRAGERAALRYNQTDGPEKV